MNMSIKESALSTQLYSQDSGPYIQELLVESRKELSRLAFQRLTQTIERICQTSLQDHSVCSVGSKATQASGTTYYSAISRRTNSSTATFHSANSSTQNRRLTTSSANAIKESKFASLLTQKGILPIDPMFEHNWSRRGAHVEYSEHDRQDVDRILKPLEFLGSSGTAIIQKVLCRRIHLARKTIRCNHKFTQEQAIDEVKHLQRLDYSHVIRVIGTYVMENELSILLYPVATFDLGTFIEKLNPNSLSYEDWRARITSLAYFDGCLIAALRYLHSKLIKHMDIKPKNVLVRDVRHSSVPNHGQLYKVYIADFGIARSYMNVDEAETEGPTMFTRKYAAPEVVDQEKRGLAADVFSLGCVLLEIVTAIPRPSMGNGGFRTVGTLSTYYQDYTDWKKAYGTAMDPRRVIEALLDRNEFGQTSYQANITVLRTMVMEWYKELDNRSLPKIIMEGTKILEGMQQHRDDGTMPYELYRKGKLLFILRWALKEKPCGRPSAAVMARIIGLSPSASCCGSPADPLEAGEAKPRSETPSRKI